MMNDNSLSKTLSNIAKPLHCLYTYMVGISWRYITSYIQFLNRGCSVILTGPGDEAAFSVYARINFFVYICYDIHNFAALIRIKKSCRLKLTRIKNPVGLR